MILLSSNTKYAEYLKTHTNPKSLTFIQTPNRNSYRKHKELINKTRNLINNSTNNENVRVLTACGPAAKVITYELSKINIIAYDIGNFFQRI